ncbi:uncharacterized protein F4822DRAFT_291238 [Hypoxylon trugodes]|uniref:uncharacterized protein n=1 Tax=Hypoxylon trugodes TaxID=326681 RepID=UPI00219F7700|nr:uncharacterized protein F4822DRAFT_291238 [Hypoxylon trugodes]KAI1387735.1 hypothetical protein F4822DRAFT_291238 [Hypoxylon trugodes]
MSNVSHPSSVGGSALKAVFLGLGFLGLLATWGRTIADGSFGLLEEAMSGEYTLPGSDSILRDRFSGIGPLDYVARTLVVFFWEAVDGSHPKTSAAGTYMAGQMATVINAQFLDGLRRGNGASTLKPSVWWFIFAVVAIGFSGSLWGVFCLATSPLLSTSIGLQALQESSLIQSPRAATLLPFATYIGFIGSMILMSLPAPSMVSYDFRQWAIVIWNLFPLTMSAIVHGGDYLLNAIFPASRREPDREAHLRVVKLLGISSIVLGFAMHVAVLTVSLSAVLFPAIFAPGYAELLHPLSVAVPPFAIVKGQTPGDGIWSFVVWDQVFGFSFVMLVFLAQLQNAMRFSDQFGSFSWIKMSIICLISSFLIGPGATIMGVSWARDRVLYGLGKKVTKPGNKIQPTLAR